MAAAVFVWPVPLRAQEKPSGTGVVTKPPKLVHFVEAVYPPDKHQAGVTARVLLSIAVGEDGKVSEVEVIEGAGADFDAAAVAAARQFVFEPAEIDGYPAPVKLTYRYDFTIVTKKVSLGPQINFEGVVLERFKKQPLPGVEVIIKDLAVSATTDEQGGFAFYDVPPGPHKIEIKHPKLIAVLTDEILRPEQKRTVKYFVEEKAEDVDEEVVVRAARIKKEAVETRIRTEEARRVPGTQGDTLKVVQNLPGVGRSSFGSGQLVVWGSAPQETRVNVDGVEIPALYHMGGLRSTINSDFVRSIDLSPGAFGAEYGRGLGGLVRIDLRPLQGEGLHGSVAADFLDSSVALTGTVTPRLRLAAAARVSYLDRLLPLGTSADIGDSFPIPRYDDYQARASYSIGKDEDISATFLASDDHLRRTIPASDPAEVRSQNNDRSSKRAFLTYSRLTHIDVRMEKVPLEEVVNQVLRDMAPEIRERKAQVRMAERLPPVRARRVMLTQVLVNLVSNAIKFVARGVEPRVEIRAEPRDGRVRLWVEDNGIGIAAEYHERIFRMFERLNRQEDYPGTGIGLAIVRKATERMGGTAGVESEPGRGSRFWIELEAAGEL